MIDKIAFSGKMASGKTTVAQYLCNTYGYEAFSFATPIRAIVEEFKEISEVEKEIAATSELRKEMPRLLYSIDSLSNLLVHIFDGDQTLSYIAKWTLFLEIFPKYYDADLTVPKGNAYRELMQTLGKSMREIDELVWTNYLVRQSRQSSSPVVVDDLRYQNEATTLRRAGFTVVRLEVPEDIRRERIEKLYGRVDEERFTHASETELDNAKFDYVIDNSAPIKDTFSLVDKIIAKGELTN